MKWCSNARRPCAGAACTFCVRIFLPGASVENYLLGAFRGTPNGKSARAEKMRSEGKRLPCMLPRGQQYLDNKIQFVHVDDMARLIAHILHRDPEAQRLTILNVAGRGEPLTFGRCIEMAQAKLVRVPGKWAMRLVLQFLWKRQISAIPPEALPYMTGEYIMNTDRLRSFLGGEYENVMRYTIADAFADSFESAFRLDEESATPNSFSRERQISLLSAIQTCNSERVGRPTRFAEAGEAHAGQHFLRLGKAFDRIGEIGVRPADAGNHGADARQDLPEVEPIEMTDDSLGLAEIEDAALASGPQDARDLAQAGIVVGEIAEAES